MMFAWRCLLLLRLELRLFDGGYNYLGQVEGAREVAECQPVKMLLQTVLVLHKYPFVLCRYTVQ